MPRIYEQYALVPLKGRKFQLFFVQTYFVNNSFKISILRALVEKIFVFKKIKARAKGLFFCCSGIVRGAVL